MPRNSSGQYTLPAGNPVQAGTLIDAEWANLTLSDIAVALTDSLSRKGSGGMLSEFTVSDGTAAAPGLAWTAQTNVGLYREATSLLGVTVGGVAVMKFAPTVVTLLKNLSAQEITATKITSSGQMLANGGLAVTGVFTASSGLTVTGATTVSGHLVADTAGIAHGLAVETVNANTLNGINASVTGTGTIATLNATTAAVSGVLTSSGTLNANIINSGTLNVTGQTTLANPVGLGNGTVAAPALAFINDSDTGLYCPTPGVVAVVTDGVERMRWSASGTSNVASVPTGTIIDFAGPAAPAGYLLCDGSAVSRTTYAALFAALGGAGSPWGVGDGSTTFNLPDLRRRSTVGTGGTFFAGPGINLGSVGGSEQTNLQTTQLPPHAHGFSDPGHTHTINDPGHTHQYVNAQLPVAGSSAYQNGPQGVQWRIDNIAAGPTESATTGISVNASGIGMVQTELTGDGAPVNQYHPCVTLNKMIKT